MQKMDDATIQKIIESYEQFYFTHDEPVPFKGHLKIYPVRVKDYYQFYACVNLFTQNKNEDPTGKGIMMSHLEYMLSQTEPDDPNHEQNLLAIINMLKMIFRVENGLKCPDCGEESFISWDEIHEILSQKEKEQKKETGKNFTEQDLYKAFIELQKCPICGEKNREEVIHLKTLENGKKNIVVDGVEIDKNDFDLLRKVIAYQNIPDYDDEYSSSRSQMKSLSYNFNYKN